MKERKKIILDTDMGPDCDDCGALAILDRLHKAGKIDLIGVTHCTSDIGGSYVIKAINEYFGVETPIGQTTRKGFLTDDCYMLYTPTLMADYVKSHGECNFEPALPLLRRLIAENDDVTLVFIGPLNNLRELLESQSDEISPLNGINLVHNHVREIIVMGGNFKNCAQPEFNILCDAPAAVISAKLCPVPMLYLGFEAAEHMITGASLENLPDDYPVKKAYKLLNGGKFDRPSWDLATVYYAALKDDPDYNGPGWILSDEHAVSFSCGAGESDDNLAAGATKISEGKGARWVISADESALADRMNDIIGLKVIL